MFRVWKFQGLLIFVLLFSRSTYGDGIFRLDDFREAYWEVAYVDKVHGRPFFKHQTVEDEYDCLQLCLQESECLSVNFKYTAPLDCQLVKYNRLNAPTYVAKSGWRHYDTGFNQIVYIKAFNQNVAGGVDACYRVASCSNNYYVYSDTSTTNCDQVSSSSRNQYAFIYDPVKGTLTNMCNKLQICPNKDVDLSSSNPNIHTTDNCIDFDQKRRFRRVHYGIQWSIYCMHAWGDKVTVTNQNLELGKCDGSETSLMYQFYGAFKAPIKVSVFKSIGSHTSLASATSINQYPNSPTYVGYSDSFISMTWSDYYLLRMQAMFVAPVTGYYTFYSVGDNLVQVYLSTDENESNKQMIIDQTAIVLLSSEWTLSGAQASSSKYLNSGNKYYMEVLLCEKDGGDYVLVGMKRPDRSEIEIIESYDLQLIPSEWAS